MRVKGVLDEDFLNYKHPSMYICTSFCDFKCDKESGEDCCQNSPLSSAQITDVDDDAIIRRYLNNPITRAIVFSGLEPFLQFDEIRRFIDKLRNEYHCDDTIVIYTGYNKNEISGMLSELSALHHIVVKFGRFIPGMRQHYDNILGVLLSSDNQYAEVIA